MPGLYRFPKSERLTGRAEFKAIYDEGTKVVGRAFVCYQVRREGQGRKFGITVSRKVGKAVVRNRVKRYLREIYRTERPDVAEDVHVVVVARPASARMTYSQCREHVRSMFRESRIVHE